jgi:hypothetical protein
MIKFYPGLIIQVRGDPSEAKGWDVRLTILHHQGNCTSIIRFKMSASYC